jgi:hypothetical protein
MKRIRYASWFGLLFIFFLYSGLVWSLSPTTDFGLTEDDSLYFSSGKALAEGHGYILPSLPGSPPATKYPILYPWLMSLIWRASPSFPQNLNVAIAFNVACGFVFLGTVFAFLRTIRELTLSERLAITALCAIHPMVLFHTANVLPEIPFAALSLGAITLATRAVSPGGGELESAASGVLSGLALLTRTLGLPIAAGLFLATMARTTWRKSFYFVGGVLPFAAFSFWRTMHVVAASSPDAAAPCSNVVRTSWLYYTSYLGFWKADVLPDGGLLQLLKQNLLLLLLQPGSYLVDPRTVRPQLLAFAPAVILSVAAIRGLALRLGGEKWQPVHLALVLYVIPLLLWNYPVMERFLLIFLPLFVAGVWLEGKALLRHIVTNVRRPREAGPGPQIGAAVFLCIVILVVGLSAARSYWRGAIVLWQTSAARRTLFSGKREAYEWLERNTPPQTKVVAYEDAALYLYTNRQAIRPVIFSPSGVAQAGHLEAEIACLTATGTTLGASYWLVADDDFGFEWEPAITRGRKREAQFETLLPQVFRSPIGDVRLYRLQTVTNPAYQASSDRH